VAHINHNETLEAGSYFLRHGRVPASLSADVWKPMGSSHVSVVGPDHDFAAITV